MHTVLALGISLLQLLGQVRADHFLISGSIASNEAPITSLSLYKWYNPFHQELVATIPIIDGAFIYIPPKAPDVDVYLLSNPANQQGIQFIWDGEVSFRIDSIGTFGRGSVLNSPLTQELSQYNKEILDSLFVPLHRLDTLLVQQKLLCPQGCDRLDSLQLQRNAAEDFSRKNLIPLMLDYVRKNPSSFISLFILTKTGMEAQRDDFRRHFMLLDEKWRRHRRGELYGL